jgi:hypothetical protein
MSEIAPKLEVVENMKLKRTPYQRKQTSINGEMVYPPLPSFSLIQSLQNHGTSTAPALSASQLRPLEAMLRPDEIQKRPLRIRIREVYPGAIEIKV